MCEKFVLRKTRQIKDFQAGVCGASYDRSAETARACSARRVSAAKLVRVCEMHRAVSYRCSFAMSAAGDAATVMLFANTAGRRRRSTGESVEKL